MKKWFLLLVIFMGIMPVLGSQSSSTFNSDDSEEEYFDAINDVNFDNASVESDSEIVGSSMNNPSGVSESIDKRSSSSPEHESISSVDQSRQTRQEDSNPSGLNQEQQNLLDNNQAVRGRDQQDRDLDNSLYRRSISSLYAAAKEVPLLSTYLKNYLLQRYVKRALNNRLMHRAFEDLSLENFNNEQIEKLISAMSKMINAYAQTPHSYESFSLNNTILSNNADRLKIFLSSDQKTIIVWNSSSCIMYFYNRATGKKTKDVVLSIFNNKSITDVVTGRLNQQTIVKIDSQDSYSGIPYNSMIYSAQLDNAGVIVDLTVAGSGQLQKTLDNKFMISFDNKTIKFFDNLMHDKQENMRYCAVSNFGETIVTKKVDEQDYTIIKVGNPLAYACDKILASTCEWYNSNNNNQQFVNDAATVDRKELIKRAKQIFLILFLITKHQEKTKTDLENDHVTLLSDMSVDMYNMMEELNVFEEVQKQPIELWHELFARGHYISKKTFAKCVAFFGLVWFLYQRYGLFKHQAQRLQLVKDVMMLLQKGKYLTFYLKNHLKY